MNKVTASPSFQGDLMIRRINVIPADARPEPASDGRHVLAHSETGHHHALMERGATHFIDKMNAFISYLDVTESSMLEHLRDYDTHAPYLLEPGKYEVRRQREYTPEGWRRAAD